MLQYPNISPDLIHIGPVRVRWYGIMYLLGFLIGRFILQRLCKSRWVRMPVQLVDDYLVAIFIGMLLGARALYMTVYYDPGPEGWKWYTPFAVWEGGLAFHGGAVGMFLALIYFARKHKLQFWHLTDALTLAAPVGLFLGRIGNFINAELWGRETDVPWAMAFPLRDFTGRVVEWTTPRHPSQLYEAFGEGLLGLVFIWAFKPYIPYQGMIAGLGLVWYGSARFIVEFFREKDEQMSYYMGGLTMGQLLCLAMIIIGAIMTWYNWRRKVPIREFTPEIPTDGAPPSPATVSPGT